MGRGITMKRVMLLFLVMMLISSFFGGAFAQTKDTPSNQMNLQNLISTDKDNKSKGKIIEGTVKEGVERIANANLVITSKDQSSKVYHVVTDSAGMFQTHLPDGNYSVKAIKQGQSDSWFSTSQSFTVEDGDLVEEENTIRIKEKNKMKAAASKQNDNVQGTLKAGQKGIKGELVVISYNNDYEEEAFFISSKNNGAFSATLPDGTYVLYGILTDDGFYRQEVNFAVDGKTLFVNGEEQSTLAITIPENKYTGRVFDNSKGLANADVLLAAIIDEEEYEYDFIQYTTTNHKGAFQLRELPDGHYVISVYHETYSAYNMIKFEVIDGQTTSSLDIKVPELNFKGTLLDGQKAVPYAYLNIEQVSNDDENWNWYYVAVDQKGNFQYRLPDGSYVVSYVEEERRNTKVNVAFEIKDGEMIQDGAVKNSISINLPPITFSGKIVDNGNVLAGHVEVIKQDEDGMYEWIYAATDEEGIYSLRLSDGEYRFVYAFLYDEYEGLPLSGSFEIRGGMLFVDGAYQKLFELQVPSVSLHGLVQDENGPISGGEIVITSPGRDFYYYKWINSDGTFSMRLEDGDYTVSELFLQDGTNAYVDIPFTIKEGSPYVNDEFVGTLEITVPPVTVTGALYDNGEEVLGDVVITSKNEQEVFWGWTKEDRRFQFRLPDGEFTVEKVYLYDGTVAIVNQPFSVQDGQLMVNGEAVELLEVNVAPVTVTGTVTDGDKQIREGFLSVVSLDENGEWKNSFESWIEQGAFSLRLPDGDYEVLDVYVFPNTLVQFNKPFTIQSGRLVVDGEEQIALQLNLLDGIRIE